MSSLITTPFAKAMALIIACLLLLGCMLLSLLYGFHRFSVAELWAAVFRFDGSNAHLIIRTVRIPSAVIGASVGASLAMAGAMMQVMTKNPLASPSILGINAGAVLFIVIAITMGSWDMALSQLVWIGFAGAALTALFVTMLGAAGRGGFRPVKLTLAGTAFAAFASSITSGLMLLNNGSLDLLLFWLVGSVTGRSLENYADIAPYLALGGLLALGLAKSLNVLAMDEEVAKGLGQWTMLVKGLVLAAVVLLAGGSVALAGPIAFVGLMVPHICRFLVGGNHFWLLPLSGLGGAILLVAADTASRFVLMPKSVPVGVTTALLGVPFLIYLARRSRE